MRTSPFIAAMALLVLTAVNTSAQNTSAQVQPPTAANGPTNTIDSERIIRAFTTKETEFRRALNTYSFKRDALIQSIGMGGQVMGEYHRVSNFTFDDQGNRYEKISFFPMPSMAEVTQEDIEDLGGIEPFALEPNKIDQYNIRYVGKEKIDELDLYIFDVTPKVIPNPKKTKDRLFTGRIWVDDQDLQIVKTKGKGVPETKINKFPTVETYREHIDGRFWFPTYSYADEELNFDNGSTLHVRMKVRYTDFTPSRATLKVTEIGENEVPTSTGIAKPIEAGVLNSKATALPKPVYPEEAKRLKISGRVTVRVVVDENGKVISAKAIDGPAALRETAEAAARQATFAPATEGGITVKVTGTLTYDF
ncbi:MAG TPA: energy transducer TonB [Pyrinomonadaceae bacterium]|jgi:TonB family protein|nr:energy transducer TonB [Pyrinomonadaceae bacterium]